MTAATGQPEPISWWDATPATPEQIETIRRDLEGGPSVGGAAFSRFAVRKLLAAYDRDHAVVAKLTPEYGVRVTYPDGREYVAVLGDDADYVRGRIVQFDAHNRDGTTREPLQREAGGWKTWDADEWEGA